MVVSPGELQVGMWVSVLEWRSEESNQKFDEMSYLFGGSSKKPTKRTAYQGDAILVKALCAPYMIGLLLTVEGSRPLHLDLRDVVLCELKKEYVKALIIATKAHKKDTNIHPMWQNVFGEVLSRKEINITSKLRDEKDDD